MIGQTLSIYRIVDTLGEGGMGQVWRAEDTIFGREVAIKVVPEEFTADAERLTRFEREARILAGQQSNVTLVTNWFDVLRETLPGS